MSPLPGHDEMQPGVKLTYDDFLLFPDDGQRHELIDGEHVVTPSPRVPHQVIVGNLYFRDSAVSGESANWPGVPLAC
jgi:hypothetical protein